MECRRSLVVAICLAWTSAGCVGQGTAQRTVRANSNPVPAQPPPGAVVQKVSDQPKRHPKPATLVAWANCREREAAAEKNSLLQSELRDQARRAYQQAIQQDSSYLPAYQGLARLYLALSDYDRAVNTLNHALHKSPKDANLWFERGVCLARKKDWGGAIQSMQRAVELDPENRYIVQTLGFTLAWSGRYDEGLAFLARAMGPANAHYNLARVHQRQERPEQCKQHLQLAIQANPNLDVAREMLTRLEVSDAPPPNSQPMPPPSPEAPAGGEGAPANGSGAPANSTAPSSSGW